MLYYNKIDIIGDYNNGTKIDWLSGYGNGYYFVDTLKKTDTIGFPNICKKNGILAHWNNDYWSHEEEG